MGYIKTIVCFANSRKTSGRCIAGKEWKDGNAGEWVRPVSNRSTHELSEVERRYQDGQYPQLLDVITVPCIRAEPQTHQRENHIIDSNSHWSRQDRLAWRDIRSWLDSPSSLWSVGDGSFAYLNNRVSIGQEEGTSIYLLQVDLLRLLVGPKASEYPKRIVRGEFSYQGDDYRMAVTDPVIERQYLKEANGQYEIRDPVLCISLSDAYEDYYYKLIASVLHFGRFT